MMGKVIMSGIVPNLTAPAVGILASDLAVGSTVYLNENGSPVPYLVIEQGIPSNSSLYDSSCNGTWLLRKELYTKSVWQSGGGNDYENSYIHSYLNSTFLGILGAEEQAAIKQAKIPYKKGYGINGTQATGANGLSTKVFLLDGNELGLSPALINYMPPYGAATEYFNGSTITDRYAYLNGAASYWWTRSPSIQSNSQVYAVGNSTSYYFSPSNSDQSLGIRPALILPSSALFDAKTLLFMEVA